MEPLVVEVVRGDVIEARHVVHAVVVRDGRVELAAGDQRLVTLLRSSGKPMQALPVVRARPDLDDEQVALLCALHRATPEQLAVVRRTLAQAPAAKAHLPTIHTQRAMADAIAGGVDVAPRHAPDRGRRPGSGSR